MKMLVKPKDLCVRPRGQVWQSNIGVREKGEKFNFRSHPPDKQEKATRTVLERAQLLALDCAA